MVFTCAVVLRLSGWYGFTEPQDVNSALTTMVTLAMMLPRMRLCLESASVECLHRSTALEERETPPERSDHPLSDTSAPSLVYSLPVIILSPD